MLPPMKTPLNGPALRPKCGSSAARALSAGLTVDVNIAEFGLLPKFARPCFRSRFPPRRRMASALTPETPTPVRCYVCGDAELAPLAEALIGRFRHALCDPTTAAMHHCSVCGAPTATDGPCGRAALHDCMICLRQRKTIVRRTPTYEADCKCLHGSARRIERQSAALLAAHRSAGGVGKPIFILEARTTPQEQAPSANEESFLDDVFAGLDPLIIGEVDL